MRLVAVLVLLVLAQPLHAQPATDARVERLARLGQVWGFLKYHHPGVAAGSIDWDSALVATVPRVQAAADAAAFERILLELLDAPGLVPACPDCAREAADSTRHNYDFTWTTRFPPAVGERLRHIHDNRHRADGRYVQHRLTATFATDTAYGAPEYPAAPQRLLALFRYWNAIRYYYPYLYVNDGEWDAVLPEFVPRMIAAEDALQYHVAVLELTTRVRDTHVTTTSRVLTQHFGARSPAFEARSIEGAIVIVPSPYRTPLDSLGLQPGDVITHVDGAPVGELRERLARYVAAGNPATFERNLIRLLLRGHADSATYTLRRGDGVVQRRVPMALPRPPAGPVNPRGQPLYPVGELVRVLPGNVGYVNMGDIEPAQVDSAVAILRGTGGVVMDVRNYPRGTMYAFANFLNPQATPFVRFTRPDPTWPGMYMWVGPNMAGSSAANRDHYRGRVAILIDERTQSHAEFTVMALQTAPDARVFGSQTAGADGNITPIALPGGINTIFTGLGVYYPDGRPTQRIGIVPDVPVRPTIAGIRAGRDEVLERALAYTRTAR